MERRVIISGCSGGGKSTLLSELSHRGYCTVSEAGRRIVAEVSATDPGALPWNDLAAFAQRAIAMTRDDMIEYANTAKWVFFDRSLIDAVTALRSAGGRPEIDLSSADYRYSQRVFFAPPWEEIYQVDDVRRHSFEAGADEAKRLEAAYRELGYDVLILPKVSVAERADWIERKLWLH